MYLNACLFNHCYVCRHVMALTALRPSQALSAALTKHFQQEGSSSPTHAGAVQHNTACALSKIHQTVKNLFESNFISIKSQKSKVKSNINVKNVTTQDLLSYMLPLSYTQSLHSVHKGEMELFTSDISW